MKKIVKKFIEKLSGYKVYDISPHKYSLVNPDFDKNNWFSHESYLRQCFSEKKIDVVIDVGANEGQFGDFIRNSVGFDGRIISFEPNPSSFVKLKNKAQADDLWDAFNYALGKEKGELDLIAHEASVLSSFLKPNHNFSDTFGKNVESEKKVRVNVEILGDVLPKIITDLEKNNIFLKMDTQGFDFEVFSGIGRVLDRIVLMQSEVSLIPLYEGMKEWKDSLSVYESKGFEVCTFFPILFKGLRVVEYDCLMMKSIKKE
ncbi:MAG: FkbM family methyltransferase [Gammaproteobacteria bacterium]|nr:FkbM family methyltransferase [Gammaproteobacteria bacterium]